MDVASLFDRSGNQRTVRVGLEQELLVADAHGRTVPVSRLRQVLAGTAYAPFLSFEPGGQVELSLPCAPDAASAGCDLRIAVAALRSDAARLGLTLASEPVDDRDVADVPLRLHTPRYVAMQRHFDTIGPAGRRMMRRTASTQVCLDWWPGEAGLEQWRALQLCGPLVAAAFARRTGPGSRLATWLEVDPGRTAFDDRLLHGDPVAAYERFARGATRFAEPHLTTLFPPVRPRGSYLEVRYLDAQPIDRVEEILAVLTTVAYDDGVRSRVLADLEPRAGMLADDWRATAAGCPELTASGNRLVDSLLTREIAA
jgi:gamma-glutamylcysteine synthetase